MDNIIELEQILRMNNFTVTCAESCRWGLIASKFTEVSGSSDIFKGSIVTYCNEIKEQELNVKKETMIEYGVVSCEVVSEMLTGVLDKFNASFAIAVSGVAGPNGGTKNKPVGTVVIGIKGINNIEDIQIYHFNGSRKEVQLEATKTALTILYSKLQNLH